MQQEKRTVAAPPIEIIPQFSVEEVLGQIGVGLYQYRLFLICGLACTADSVEVSLLSFLSLCAQDDWQLTDEEASSITSVVFAGQLLGTLFWGPLADKYGRRKMSIACGVMITVAGFFSAFAPNLALLLLLRFFVGFGVGGFTIPFDLLAEFIPTKYRVRFLMGVAMFWSFGSMFVATMAWALLDEYGWRMLTAIVTLPVFVAVLLTVYLPESPRWLLSKHRHTEAAEILKKAAIFNQASLNGEFRLIHKDLEIHEGLFTCREILVPAFRNMTLALWAVWFSFGFTYYGAILLVVKVFEKGETKSGGCSFDYEDIFMSASAEIGGLFVALVVIEKLGRRYSQLASYGTSGIMTILVGFLAYHNSAPALISVAAAIMRMGVFVGSNATWIQTPELYPTEIRGTGHSAANAFARIGGALIPYWVYAPLNILVISSVIGLFNLLAGFSALLLKETANVALDDEDEITEETSLKDRSRSNSLQITEDARSVPLLKGSKS